VFIRQAPAPSTGVTDHLPCQLDKSTQDLIKLIFDNDMFNDAMKDLEIGALWLCLVAVLSVHRSIETHSQYASYVTNNIYSTYYMLSSKLQFINPST